MGSQFLGKCFLGMVDEEEEEVAGHVWEGRRCKSQDATDRSWRNRGASGESQGSSSQTGNGPQNDAH
jgi:hypothetical protein